MSHYSVTEGKNTLPSLIDKTIMGEAVVITRHGKPVAELRPAGRSDVRGASSMYDWLRARRDVRPAISVSSAVLLNAMYDERVV